MQDSRARSTFNAFALPTLIIRSDRHRFAEGDAVAQRGVLRRPRSHSRETGKLGTISRAQSPQQAKPASAQPLSSTAVRRKAGDRPLQPPSPPGPLLDSGHHTEVAPPCRVHPLGAGLQDGLWEVLRWFSCLPRETRGVGRGTGWGSLASFPRLSHPRGPTMAGGVPSPSMGLDTPGTSSSCTPRMAQAPLLLATDNGHNFLSTWPRTVLSQDEGKAAPALQRPGQERTGGAQITYEPQTSDTGAFWGVGAPEHLRCPKQGAGESQDNVLEPRDGRNGEKRV